MNTRAGIDYGEPDLKSFVRFLIDTGRASLEVETKIPDDREALHHAVDRLDQLSHAIEAGELSPAQSTLFLRALVCAFEIGSFGTASKNTVDVIDRWGTTPARAGRSQLKQADDRSLMEIAAGLRRPGDEVHAYKTADAILVEVNQAREARGLSRVGRDRLARLIKDNPVVL